jgi:hypothetical protein
MEWLARCDYDYLMGKASPREQVFDRDESVRVIVEIANSDLREVLLARRSDVRRYVQARFAAREEWSGAFESWAELQDAGGYEIGPAPMLEDFLPDRADYVDTLSLELKKGCEHRSPDVFYDDVGAVPSGYEMWFQVWKALRDEDFGPYDSSCIFTAAGRREVADALDHYFSDGAQERAADFCAAAEIWDYYGDQKYADCSVWQIEALQHGARMILAELAVEDRKWMNVLRRRLAASIAFCWRFGTAVWGSRRPKENGLVQTT